MSTPLQLRGRVAALTRSRSHDDPELVESRQLLAAAKLEQYIAQVVADAPPLTPAQRDRLSLLLRGGAE